MSFCPMSTASSSAVSPSTLRALRSAPRVAASRAAGESPRLTASNSASVGPISLGGLVNGAAPDLEWVPGIAAGSAGLGATTPRPAPPLAMLPTWHAARTAELRERGRRQHEAGEQKNREACANLHGDPHDERQVSPGSTTRTQHSNRPHRATTPDRAATTKPPAGAADKTCR